MKIIKILFMAMLIVVVFMLNVYAKRVSTKRINHESFYVNTTCKGQIEVRNLDSTRTDCVYGEFAMEYDFANKWAECLGQALHYARIRNMRPACVLIIENTRDCKYVRRAQGLGVLIFTLDALDVCKV